MLEQVLPLVSVPLLLSALLRSRDIAPGGNRERRAVALALLTFGVAVLLATPWIGGRVADAVDVPQIDVLLGRLVVVLGVFAILRGFRLTLGPGQKRLPLGLDIALVVAVATTMTVSFAVQAVPYGGDLIIDHGYELPVALFVGSFSLYLAWCFTAILRGWRGLRRQPHLEARTGVRLTALAAATGLLYVASRLAGQVALMTTDAAGFVEATREVCLATGALAAVLLTLGASASGVVAVARRLRDEVRRAGHMLQLYPLWRDVVTVAPEVALASRRFAPWRLVNGRTDFYRYRMVIEVLDGRSLLRARGHGRPVLAAGAAGDAADLAALVDDARSCVRRRTGDAAPVTDDVRSTMADETAHLLAVAAEYRRLRRGRPLTGQAVRA
ncbi:MAB_1171c family putative transporter [Kineococcus arenarius]|uniref:MAB_1171c family putative transporter n=1 Tax=Kineococcus sp. SYSU DK007 TaxID=3383128 RepID=UPI003D7E79E7